MEKWGLKGVLCGCGVFFYKKKGGKGVKIVELLLL